MAIVTIESLTYTYPGTSTPALRDLHIEFQRGSFTGLIGANGAGKSTLCNTIAGYVPNFYRGQLEGQVTVAGRDTQATPLSTLVLTTGLVFQNPFNQISGTKFTVFEEVGFGLENLGVPRAEMQLRIQAALERTGITDLAGRSPYSLSGGQQQRLALASILVMQPEVLVLDEPTSQLDPIGTREMFEAVHELSEQGITIVMAEHKLEWLAAFADRVLLLDGGRIALDGPAREVLSSPALLDHGMRPNRYTTASLKAKAAGLWPAGQTLPVTLEQAIQSFQQVLHAR